MRFNRSLYPLHIVFFDEKPSPPYQWDPFWKFPSGFPDPFYEIIHSFLLTHLLLHPPSNGGWEKART